jgi:hypothetical protein
MKDSLTLAIKASTVDEHSSPDSPNSYGEVNKTFARFVVEMLAVNLLFDCCFCHIIFTHPSHHPLLMPVMFLM